MSYNLDLQSKINRIESILDTINSLPEASEGVELPELTNEGSSADLLAGKQLIDGDGKVVTGTIESVIQATPSINVSSSGLITASAVQSAGYISGGTKSATKQLTTQSGKTITPTKSSQTAVESGVYTTGKITVGAIPSQYITTTDATAEASEIFKGETAYVNGVKKTGTFTIESELNAQDNLITQIQTALQGKGAGSGGETIVDDVSKAIIERTIMEIEDDSIETIGYYAFDNCTKLKTANFPVCTHISIGAFSYCYNLTTVSFPACTHIGNSVFYACTGLTTVSFPACIMIGSSAFVNCSNIISVNFPVCQKIHSNAFNSCYGLTLVDFPACQNVYSNAFSRCYNLTYANFPTCTNIKDNAFFSCNNLLSINLDSCTNIGNGAFYECYNLSSLILGASSVCTLSNSYAFRYTPYAGYSASFSGTPHIYVPASLVDAYKSATNWTYFSSYFSSIESLNE